jgi:hypothetical protein
VSGVVIVWLNGTHGVGKTTASALVQQLIPDSRVFDAEKVLPVRHFVLHADLDTLRRRIDGDTILGPSTFRIEYLDLYAEAARTWLHDEAEVVDTTHLTPPEVARQIAVAVNG